MRYNILYMLALLLPAMACREASSIPMEFKSESRQDRPAQVVATSESNPKDDWLPMDDYGPRIWIARNLLSGNLARTMYILIKPTDFAEENLKRVFVGLAAKYTHPHNLAIHCFSDKNILEEELQRLNSTAVFARKPVNRRFLQATYYRNDGEESMSYTPDSDKGQAVRIVLRKKEIRYSGNADQDLLLAVEENDIDKARTLLAIRANVDVFDDDGESALMLSILSGSEISIELLKKTRDIDHKNNEGWTALMYAAADGKTALVRRLLDRGANVNAKNQAGDTPLILAACREQENTVKLLLSRGADPNQRENRGLTVLSLVTRRWCGTARPSLIQLLIAAGAKE